MIPTGELKIEWQQTNPPKPIGYHVMVDGRSVAALTLEQIENAYIDQEEAGWHDLNDRQDKLLTGVVNAIRGDPPPGVLWSHHDAAELARDLMRASRDLLKACESMRAIANWPRVREAGAIIERGGK